MKKYEYPENLFKSNRLIKNKWKMEKKSDSSEIEICDSTIIWTSKMYECSELQASYKRGRIYHV